MAPPSSLPSPAHRRTLLVWMFIAALPVLYVALLAITFSRNIVYWDEFDTALALILRLDHGADLGEVIQRLFAINNEHRMLTSRLLFVTSYWLTGTINFHVIGAIGNLFLLGACAILVCSVTGWQRRVRLGVVLAFLMFQLEHFENFFWSGASIDHFQVIMLVVGAIAALARAGDPPAELTAWADPRLAATQPSSLRPRRPFSARRRSFVLFVAAAFLALLATFTLAHGTLAWPLGGLLLLQQRRWKHLLAWAVCALVAAAAFLFGFEFNPGHHIDAPAGKNLGQILRYFLALLGGPLTLGAAANAPFFGAVLLAGVGVALARGALTREPIAMFTAFFAVAALGLVAIGRAGLAGSEINSRYLVLGALGWAMLAFVLLELAADVTRPFRHLAWMLPALAAFTLAANLKFAPIAEGYIEARDRAATSFMHHGKDGLGITRLHPREGHADALLREAAERGVYTLPAVSHRVPVPAHTPNPRIVAHFDEVLVNDRAVTFGGWAMIPGRASRRGQARVLLRSAGAEIAFTTVTFVRADVARAYHEPKWIRSGFRAVIDRSQLPQEDFEVGVLILIEDRAESLMTENCLLFSSLPERPVRSPSGP